MNFGEARAKLRLVPDPPAPQPGPQPPTVAQPGTVQGNTSWAKYAGKLGAALTVTVSAASIRKGGHEPNEPDDSDVTLLQDALEEGLRLKYGAQDLPWWLGAALAAGGVYAGMRVGATKLETKPKNIGGEVSQIQQGAITPDKIAEPEPGEAPPVNSMASLMPKPVRTTGT